MKLRKIPVFVLTVALTVAILLLPAGASVFADDTITLDGSGNFVITGSGVTEQPVTDTTATTDTTAATDSTTTTDATGTTTTDSTATTTDGTASTTTDGTTAIAADQSAPTIVKHPGSEYDHAAGDSVLFTAACSKDVQADWFFNDGVPISQIGSVYPGVSATVATTIYDSTYPGTKVTISNLTRASSGIRIYVEFTTDYGILKSNEATITVTSGTDVVVPTATPTTAPVATPTTAPVATATPAPAAAVTPAPAAGTASDSVSVPVTTAGDTSVADAGAASEQIAISVPETGNSVDVSSYSFNSTSSAGTGYQFSAEEQTKWSAPGATLAVAACAIVAIVAFVLMALYSMGVLRFRALERLVGGKDYVSPDDEDDYEEDDDEDEEDEDEDAYEEKHKGGKRRFGRR